MAKSRFPTWPVRCFHCDVSLEAAPEQDKDYPDGHGRYRRTCLACGKHTYYDRRPEVPREAHADQG